MYCGKILERVGALVTDLPPPNSTPLQISICLQPQLQIGITSQTIMLFQIDLGSYLSQL